MGTSSSYNGPGKRPDLIPPWAKPESFPEEPPESQSPDLDLIVRPEPEPLPSFWAGLKRQVGRAASVGLGGGAVTAGRIASGYVRALGGRKAASQAAVAGVSTGAGLASFLAEAGQRGLGATLASLNLPSLDVEGADAVLAAIAGLIAPDGAEREDAIARSALLETFRDWHEEHADEADLGLANPDASQDMLSAYLTNYVVEKVNEELGACIERRGDGSQDIDTFFQTFKDSLRAFINLDLSAIDSSMIDWKGPDGREFIRRQLETAYGLLEDQA